MNHRSIWRFVGILLLIGWLFAVTISYYVVHKPFSEQNALAILDAFANLAVAGAIFLAALVLGRWLTRAFEFGSALEALCLSAGLGGGLISFATFGLGLVGALNSILFWALLLAVLILLRHDTAAALAEMRSMGGFRNLTGYGIFIAAALLIGLGFAMTPPIGWDAQTYHLVEARQAIALARLAPPPDIVYFSFPSLGEMLFLAAMLLKGDIAAQLTHFTFFLLTLGAVHAFALRYFNSFIAWVAAAILAAVPSLLTVATNAYVDATLTFFAFAAFYALMIAFEKSESRWYVLAGMFAGFAASVKYTALIVPIAIVAMILFTNRPRKIRFILYFSLAALLFALPFYLRNLFFTGNPVYPFFLGGPYWDGFRAEHFSRFGTGLITTPLKILTAPWDATILGVEGGVDYSATIGALLLALLPLGLVRATSKSEGQDSRIPFYALIFSLVLYLFWLSGIAESKLLIQTRLLFPAFPTLAILAAVSLDRAAELDLPQFSLARFARLFTALVLGITLLSYVLAFAANNPLAFITGAQSRDQFLRGTLGEYYTAAQYINEKLPRTSSILALWEPRSYYIARNVQPDVLLDSFPHTLSRSRDADTIARTWRAAGYTHILLSRRGLDLLVTTQYDPISLQDVEVLQTTLARHARLIYGEALEVSKNEITHAESAAYALYQLEGP